VRLLWDGDGCNTPRLPDEGQFGVNVIAQSALSRYDHRLPYRKIADRFEQLHGLELSGASAWHATERAARAGRCGMSKSVERSKMLTWFILTKQASNATVSKRGSGRLGHLSTRYTRSESRGRDVRPRGLVLGEDGPRETAVAVTVDGSSSPLRHSSGCTSQDLRRPVPGHIFCGDGTKDAAENAEGEPISRSGYDVFADPAPSRCREANEQNYSVRPLSNADGVLPISDQLVSLLRCRRPRPRTNEQRSSFVNHASGRRSRHVRNVSRSLVAGQQQ